MRLRYGFLLLAVAGLAAGCEKTGATSGPTATTSAKIQARGATPAAQQATEAPAGAQMSLRKTIARQGVFEELRQLALFYQDYNTTFNRSPARLDDLKASMERDAPKLYQALKDDYYVVVWNVNSFSSNRVLAYEKEADVNNMRFVAVGDGSVKKMNPEELEAALQQR